MCVAKCGEEEEEGVEQEERVEEVLELEVEKNPPTHTHNIMHTTIP